MITYALVLVLFLAVLALLSVPLGRHVARVVSGERTFLHPVLGPVERLLYRAAGVDPTEEMTWRAYAGSLLVFSLVGTIGLYVLQRVQGSLPLNPQRVPGVSAGVALNVAASWVTATNWQSYVPESTMSHLTQMVGLTWHNFTAAAAGGAMLLALVRGMVRQRSDRIGNFWADLVRITLYVLLPVAFVIAILFVWQGVPQTLHGAAIVTPLEGGRQVIALGPVASQEAIKLLGVNGGGFFNANSAHPFENPTPLSNLIQLFAVLLIPSSLTCAFGVLVGDRRQGWALWAAMAILLAAGFALAAYSEGAGTHTMTLNLEGKEMRFSPVENALSLAVNTDTSCGAANVMYDSLTPLSGLVATVNIALGEVVFGGVGSGLYGMLAFALVTVFLGGLMIGRAPEYLGKKIEAREMKLVMMSLLITPAVVLTLTAIAMVIQPGLEGMGNRGPHGFAEVLYAYSSATNGNGSSFAGLTATNSWWLYSLTAAMLAGRFLVAIPLLAIGGSLARKPRVAPSTATLPTASPLFVGMLVGVVLLVSALTYFPALALGPLLEHLVMRQGALY